MHLTADEFGIRFARPQWTMEYRPIALKPTMRQKICCSNLDTYPDREAIIVTIQWVRIFKKGEYNIGAFGFGSGKTAQCKSG
jgi:hypothetical protein